MLTRAGKIYVMTQDGLLPLVETEYSAELLLQRLLAEYPDLLAGDQMHPRAPRRWLLVSQEAAVPDSVGGLGRWSLDHLFIDQDAVPTLVEVKRSTDTRIRREVVGQMLDYAANVAAHWAPGQIRLMFEERCRAGGRDPDQDVMSLLELNAPTETEPEEASPVDRFWEKASDNLASRRLRLLFVADVIPPELLRIIEFLNESMARTEVLGVEVRQFAGQGQQTLVPRVVGQTAAAEDLKRPTTASATLDEDTFFDALRGRGHSEDEIARRLYLWARSRNLRIWWGKAYMSPMWDHPTGGGHEFTFDVNTRGALSVPFHLMARRPTFASRQRREALGARLSAVPGVSVPPEALEMGAKFRLSDLRDPAAQRAFVDVFDWVLDLFRSDWVNGPPRQVAETEDLK